ncbi:aminoacyltransferase [Nocardioidaceae bacterium]|nr:aminoacyltransferase [Nocardioidaceae bacterium]
MQVRTISGEQHAEFLRRCRSASFLQTPAWAAVKPEWAAESIGWFTHGATEADDELVGVGLVLYRQLPKVKRYLAYLPEGPVIDWASDDLVSWLGPMSDHVKKKGAFGVRIGAPVVHRRWDDEAIKDGIKDESATALTDLPPTGRYQVGAAVVGQLRDAGWVEQGLGEGFSAGQPRFNFHVPLRHDLPDGEPLTEDEALARMNQQWRRNIRKADKAGVRVTQGSLDPTDGDLAAFHALYVETAQRDGFTPRPASYFDTMVTALGAEDPDRIRLYLAHHEGDLLAATIWISVGTHAWYSYGASSTVRREVQASNAVQWQMMRDSLALGCDVYDLRGITDTVDAEDAEIGLIRFKVGTGGQAVEYVGEWDLPLRTLTYKAFELYMSRR